MTWIRAGALALAVLVLLIFVGRHEGSTWQAKENRGIATIRQAVGAELKHPKGFRGGPTFACLIYPDGSADPYGLELCFAPSGAIIEAIHRGPGLTPTIWTLRSDPGASTVRENPALIAALLDKLGAQTGTAIQVGGQDIGGRIPLYPVTP
jgi:hypothetical protein